MKTCDCCRKDFPDKEIFHKDEDTEKDESGICHSCWLDDCGSGFDLNFGDS